MPTMVTYWASFTLPLGQYRCFIASHAFVDFACLEQSRIDNTGLMIFAFQSIGFCHFLMRSESVIYDDIADAACAAAGKNMHTDTHFTPTAAFKGFSNASEPRYDGGYITGVAEYRLCSLSRYRLRLRYRYSILIAADIYDEPDAAIVKKRSHLCSLLQFLYLPIGGTQFY